ncbi:hypothetical protein H5410_011628 [Solanum commersonii]|uniref:Uncharacterized protein n=1 Tax=Solanum commersonii TaxID=4109 RepID=A0A9J6AQF2_SOLCO|nr:hypothetical protein H5410_011628 [Solanum commersonii]
MRDPNSYDFVKSVSIFILVKSKLHEKITLIQQYVRPENLDIKPTFQNESSWLVINNLLIFASTKDNPPGADDFLPVLIYVTIKNLDLCEHVEVLAVELWVLKGQIKTI